MREVTHQTRAEIALVAKSQQQIKWLEAIQENAGDLPGVSDQVSDAQLTADGANAQAGSALALIDSLRVRRFVFVDSISDLPTQVDGIITLAADTSYIFTGNIDLFGARLVCGANTALLGGSSENSSITSTGLAQALITSQSSLPMRAITITASLALSLDAAATPGAAIDWIGVNFTNCASIGTIANYGNVILTDCSLLNSANLIFDGSHGTVAMTQTLLSGSAGQTVVTFPATAVINRRIRLSYCACVTSGGGTVLNVNNAATIPTEGYLLDTVNFAGAGTFTAGVQYSDNKALFNNCRGINNSVAVANYYMVGNATATVIGVINTPVKGAGTTTNSALTQRFTHTDNRATYSTSLLRTYKLSASLVMTSGNNQKLGIYFAKNGAVIPESVGIVTTGAAGRAEGVYIHSIAQLNANDFVEIWVENKTAATNIVVENLNVIVEEIN